MDSKLLIACLILILLYGCSSVEHVPTARVERDSIYMTKYLCDSIYVHDSIYVERTDTVQMTIPVERELSRWEQTEIVRQLNSDVLRLTNEKATVELELQRYKCVVPKCASRQPQNGY